MKMVRIRPLDEATADTDTAELLNTVKMKMGSVPNMISTMANSPTAVKAYLGFSHALSTGNLSPRLREQIALAVSETNGCEYCLAAHTVLGMGVGLTEQETIDARRGTPNDEKESIAIGFARQIVQNRGMVTDADVERVLRAGYTEGDIGEIVVNVVLNLLTNYFNIVAGTEVDFPAAPDMAA
jgi:uncharacterized peroxidase-related enzyme